jgi:antirestriction protein ArdC
VTDKLDVYAMITDRMIALLESGVTPWRKTWKTRGTDASVPANYISNRPYSGVNSWLLWGEALSKGYGSRYWLTFNQVRQLGGKVIKGQKATPVVFWRILTKREKDATTGQPVERKIFFLRYYNVFNLGQTEGCREIKRAEEIVDTLTVEPIEAAQVIADEYFSRESLPLHHGGDSAHYSFADSITMPTMESFVSGSAYYATLFHEMTHSTGAKSRLDRFDMSKGQGIFGSESYSKEELVAEMGAAFLCAEAGILQDVEANTAAYLHGWVSRLKADPKLLIGAAAQAEKATRYILTGSAVAPKVAEEAEEMEAVAA